MAKKLLCIVLSVAMLLGTFAIAASAGDCYTHSSLADAQAELAEKQWEVEYDASVDYKDLINRTWLTGVGIGVNYANIPAVAASQEVIEANLYFWEDEIIEAYNAATTNEEYWALYNKMATPQILEYDCDYCGLEYEVMYDFAYEYKAEEKAVMDIEIVADTEYAKAGDTITVDVYATSNFATPWVFGGIFYDKQYLEPVSVVFDTETHTTWKQMQEQLDLANGNSDLRDLYWPESMLTEENLAKYGVSYMVAQFNEELGVGNYVHGMKFAGERLFTATYTVKADVPEGTELEFFVPADATLSMEDFLYNEMDGRSSPWSFRHVVYAGMEYSETMITLDNHSIYGQTVTANTETVIIGEEPAPAVKGEIVEVTPYPTYIGDTATTTVEVTGAPETLRVETPDGYLTFTRDDVAVSIEATDAGEIWTIEIAVNAETVDCTVYADYGDLGATDGTAFTLTGLVKQDLSIHSIVIPDMYPDAQNGGVILAGKHDVIIKTSTDVAKIQFYDPADGTTYTYTSWSGAGKVPYEDVDGERIWTISHAFGPYGTRSLIIRTRSETTFFAATESTLDATVVY